MVKTKNILIISAADPYRSAGIVALDLLNGLSTFEGNNVKLITKFCKPQNQNVISFLKPIEYNFERIINKFKKILINLKLKENKIKYTNPDYHVLDFDQTKTFYKTQQILNKASFKPSHIIILFTQNFISFKNIYELNKTTGAPIYLYPMDMSLFTGACHYAWDCNGYIKSCLNCPAIITHKYNSQSSINLNFKIKHIQNIKIVLLACNNQIKEQIEKSALFIGEKIVNEIYPIPDRNIFKSQNKNECKKYFNIDPNQIVLFFGSVSQNDTRKGMKILKEALLLLQTELLKLNFNLKQITFITAGSNKHKTEWTHFDFNFIDLGYVTDYKMLSKVYNASDFFISPSIEETGPTMVLQSILCKTLVISFDLGYINEFYNCGLRELVAKQKNPTSLMSVIKNSLLIDSNFKQDLLKELDNINQKLDFKVVMTKINNSLLNG